MVAPAANHFLIAHPLSSPAPGRPLDGAGCAGETPPDELDACPRRGHLKAVQPVGDVVVELIGHDGVVKSCESMKALMLPLYSEPRF